MEIPPLLYYLLVVHILAPGWATLCNLRADRKVITGFYISVTVSYQSVSTETRLPRLCVTAVGFWTATDDSASEVRIFTRCRQRRANQWASELKWTVLIGQRLIPCEWLPQLECEICSSFLTYHFQCVIYVTSGCRIICQK
jgi:hypothetical protein